jgi:uncharacterized membrane protein
MARDESRDDRRETSRRPASRQRRLDVPRDTRRALMPKRPEYDPEALGRYSERIARFLGTGAFLVWMTVIIVAWVAWNFWGPGESRWDEYPFIFLTLMLSLQASYSAPLILLAQNRQEGRDRVNLEQDRDANARAHADMEFLAREVASLRLAIGEVATRDYVRSELRSLLAELDERAQAEDSDHDEADPATPRSLEP